MARVYDNYSSLIDFTRASYGTALRPISYGDELVENGGFSTDSDWVLSSGITISDGVMNVDTPANSFPRQEYNFSGLKTYIVTYEIKNYVSGSLTVRFESGSDIIAADDAKSENGVFSVNLYLVEDCNKIVLRCNSGSVFEIDNISVREVLFDQPNGTLTLFNHPTNVPRIEYDADGNRLGLLVEEQRTNLITYSNPTNGQWTVAQGTVDENDAASPDGFTSASTYKTNTSNAEHYTEDLVSVTSGTKYTFSVYLKKKGYDTACIRIPSIGFVDNAYFIFNFDTKQITTSVGTMDSYGVEDVGNGWLRVYMVRTANASAGALFRVHAKQPTAFTGDGDSGAYIYNAQVEVGSFMTSPIPTSGSTATRSADVASIGVSEFGYNQSEGTVVVEAAPNHAPTSDDYLIQIDNGSSTKRYAVRLDNVTATKSFVINSGATTTISNGTRLDAGESIKIAFAFSDGDQAVSIDGGSVQVGSAVALNGLTTLRIGSDDGVSRNLDGHIKSVKYYPRRLTDAQLQELTS